jgi:Mlc titration factor MtfA (ptsG expression regulator)
MFFLRGSSSNEEKDFPPAWREILERRVPYFQRLPETTRRNLFPRILRFLRQVQFEGCGGLKITPEMQVTTAAYAGVLTLGEGVAFYPVLKSVLIYPDAFKPRVEEVDEAGVVHPVEEYQEGEYWNTGVVIFSWRDVRRDLRTVGPRNILFHEFAHELFDETAFSFTDAEASRRFVKLFHDAYRRHCESVEQGIETVLDPYGAEDEAEFFSVVTETFFEAPSHLYAYDAALFDGFRDLYGQDPREYGEDPRAHGSRRSRR